MPQEHPVEKHEFQLDSHERRLEEMSKEIAELRAWQSASQEQAKTIFNVVGEIKAIIKEYTTEMRQAITELAAKMEARFIVMDKEISELKLRPARRWDAAVQTVLTVLIGLILGYMFSALIGGKP